MTTSRNDIFLRPGRQRLKKSMRKDKGNVDDPSDDGPMNMTLKVQIRFVFFIMCVLALSSHANVFEQHGGAHVAKDGTMSIETVYTTSVVE
jgi:hypothetical protein